MIIKYDRFQITDIDPIILVRKLIAKAYKDNIDEEQSVEISIFDFYQAYMHIRLLENELADIKFKIFDSLNEELCSAMSSLLKIKIRPKTSIISAIQYYNGFLEKKLEFLQKGRGYLSLNQKNIGMPIIVDYKITKNDGLQIYKVNFQLKKLIEAVKKFVEDYSRLSDKMHQLWESAIDHNAPSITKQGQLFIEQVTRIQENLGINKVNIGMKDWGMRVTAYVLDNGSLLTHPFCMNYRGKSILPLYLEAHGIIDIHDISLINKPLDYADANLQYTVSRPCVKNIFDSDNTAIPVNQRKTLTETQIVIIENIFQEIKDSLIFAGKSKLMNSFREIIIWFIKKISFCLEEESFLHRKVIDYLQKNKNKTYLKIEDDFFLPFIYEKLINDFGNHRVVKKPEKFKGEIDIFFDNSIPIELKVWRKHKDIESTVDEKFLNLGQAATYASIDRIGLMVILDISSIGKGIKTIENCWRILTKEFEINKNQPTKIIALLFDCNHSQPSRL